MKRTYSALDCEILPPIDCGANGDEVLSACFGTHGFKGHAVEACNELVLGKLVSACRMSIYVTGL